MRCTWGAVLAIAGLGLVPAAGQSGSRLKPGLIDLAHRGHRKRLR
jgi:hypothetical protein